MGSPYLVLVFLLAASFTLATQLGLWREQDTHHGDQSHSVLETLMGDSQRLFANHFFTKADVYLHAGVYPSIFDQAQRAGKSHLAQVTETPAASPGGTPPAHADNEHEGHADHADHEDHDHDHDEGDVVTGFLGKPRDWVDAFGRNFFPTRHVHLDSKNQQEILPWLRLAAELNPNEVETYTVAAYWLRHQMGKVKEAEQFLRQGWRANPDSYEILFELARLQEENHHDAIRARNLYLAALQKWQRSQSGKDDPDQFSYMQITAGLAHLEEGEGHYAKAIEYLEMLRRVSPSADGVQAHIDALKSKVAK
jgi:tetratricopeptide (TPR) repeat protein